MNRDLILRVLTGVALVGVAVVHLFFVGDYYLEIGERPLSLGDQFYAQAAVAVMLTVALLVRPHLLVWLAAAGFAAGSLAVLVYSRKNCLRIYGFDGCFTESWAVKGAKPAAYFEGAALALALIGAFLSYQARGRRSVNA